MLEKSLEFLEKAKKLTDVNLPLKVAEVGKPVVDMWYRTATEEGHDYIIGAEPNGKGACLIAYGDDVVFREFGAGIFTDNSPLFPNAQGLPTIQDGSWSATEGKGIYADKGYWYYRKKGEAHSTQYVGVVPTLGMYNALVTMRAFLDAYVKEVMK